MTVLFRTCINLFFMKKQAAARDYSLAAVFFCCGIYFFLFSSPFLSIIFDGFSAHDSSRIFQVGVFVVSAACFLFTEHIICSKKTAIYVAWCCVWLLALALISIFSSPYTTTALCELSLALGLFGIALAIGLKNFESQYKLILFVSVCSATVYSIFITAIMFITSISGVKAQVAELFFGYDNFRFYNHVQTICLPLLALVTASKCCSIALTRMAWVGLVTGFALLIASAGRATAMGLLLAIILTLIIFKSAARTFAWHLFLATLLGALLNVMILIVLPFIIHGHPADFEIQNTQEARKLLTTNSRDYLWDLSLQYIKQHPWFGIGPMHFAHHPNAKAGHPHNIYLQVAAEWGIPMILSCLFIALHGLKRMVMAIHLCVDASHKTIGIALFSGCIAVMVDGCFSGNFVMPISQMWIAVLIGLAMSWTRSNRVTETPIIPTKTDIYLSHTFKILLLTSQIWLVWSIYPEVIHLHDHLEQVRKQLPQTLPNAPRFWSFGWF